MLAHTDPLLHLTYCLNVHPGETWPENLAVIREKAMAVREAVSPDQPFGLGLRLGRAAADSLAIGRELTEFQSFLADNRLYAFTVNGFPYGSFHGRPVKASVYEPDWRQHQRLTYTNRLADILAGLLPEGVTGSISTVPGSYKAWIKSETDVARMASAIAACARHLVGVRAATGRHITLGLEPEPDCFLETSREAADFLEQRVFPLEPAARRHVGVCFDTCHLALQFEDIVASLGFLREKEIVISKIQLSAALRAELTGRRLDELQAFMDSVYLHQTRIRTGAGEIQRYPDLSDDVLSATVMETGELRSHFHVPLYFEGAGALRSTAAELSPEFFQAVRAAAVDHLEIETYTFDVLPAELRAKGVVDSVVREFGWVRERLG
jgi:hypothetical protein